MPPMDTQDTLDAARAALASSDTQQALLQRILAAQQQQQQGRGGTKPLVNVMQYIRGLLQINHAGPSLQCTAVPGMQLKPSA